MTLDISTEALIGASLFMGAQLALLTLTVQSNRNQGRRIGKLEKARAGRLAARRAVRVERRRVATRGVGVPITDTRGIPVKPHE
jgi:hypothetical protein